MTSVTACDNSWMRTAGVARVRRPARAAAPPPRVLRSDTPAHPESRPPARDLRRRSGHAAARAPGHRLPPPHVSAPRAPRLRAQERPLGLLLARAVRRLVAREPAQVPR